MTFKDIPNPNEGDDGEDIYLTDGSLEEYLDNLDPAEYDRLFAPPAADVAATPTQTLTNPFQLGHVITSQTSPVTPSAANPGSNFERFRSPKSPSPSSSSSTSSPGSPAPASTTLPWTPSTARSISSPPALPAATPQEPALPAKRQASIFEMFTGKKDVSKAYEVTLQGTMTPSGVEKGKIKAARKPKGDSPPTPRGVDPSSSSGTPVADTSAAPQEAPPGQKPKKYMPFYKKMPGTPFSVDAFSYGPIPDCSVYFLTLVSLFFFLSPPCLKFLMIPHSSHFHSDHYQGLNKRFDYGQIFCSRITARLVAQELGVEPSLITSLDLDTPYDIEGVKVTFLEANHCPGAVLVLFELRNGKTLLHTGDFRANASMPLYPAMKERKIDTLYLDTTYCQPTHAFPSQQEVLDSLISQ